MSNVHNWYFSSDVPFTREEISPLVEKIKKLTWVRCTLLYEDGSFVIDTYGMHNVNFPNDFSEFAEKHNGGISLYLSIECCDSFSFDYDKESKHWINREPTYKELGMISHRCEGCPGWDENYRWYNSEHCESCDVWISQQEPKKKMKYEEIE
jgi:hypothetical protein